MSHIAVTADIWTTLDALAKRRGLTVEEILAEAIGLELAVSEARDNGYRMLLEKNGRLRKLVPR